MGNGVGSPGVGLAEDDAQAASKRRTVDLLAEYLNTWLFGSGRGRI